MQIKTHEAYRTIVALCDSDLIGKTFEEGIRQIELTTNFFQGEEKTEPEILEIIETGCAEDYTFNIVGEDSIKVALKSGIIDNKGIVRIQGIPIALVLL